MFAWLNDIGGGRGPAAPDSDRFLEVLAPGRCPVCFLRDMFGMEYIRNLLLESVNDGEMRERLRGSWGFCRRHAWKAAAQCDRLGLAILYAGLLEDQLRQWERGRWRLFGWRRECPACVHEREVERAYAAQIVRWWMTDGGFRAALTERGGVCVRHARRVLECRMSPECRRGLLEAFQSKGRACLSELKSFLAKQNFSSGATPTGSEENAWKEALRLVAGELP